MALASGILGFVVRQDALKVFDEHGCRLGGGGAITCVWSVQLSKND